MAIIKEGWVKLDSKTPGTRSQKMLAKFKQEVIGQDSVLEDFVDSLDVSEAGFRDPHKPRYVGLLLGPKGVGKTLSAKILALTLLGKKTALTRIDCQLLSEDHTVSKLIGSPPGYVGYKEPPWLAQENLDRHSKLIDGKSQKEKELAEAKKNLMALENELIQMIEFRHFANERQKKQVNLDDDTMDTAIKAHMVKRRKIMMYVASVEAEIPKEKVVTSERPVSILLLDEIEKAHPKIFNALLGVCEEGQMMMSSGLMTYFDNCYILMTSNAGSKAMSELLYEKKTRPIGFDLPHEGTKAKEALDKDVYVQALEAAKKVFPPEFLDRCDRISVFRPLSAESIYKIFDIELRNFENEHTRPLKVELALAPEVKDFIVRKATDHPGDGARLLNKKISKYLTRQLARINNREGDGLHTGDTIHLVLDTSNPDPDKHEIVFYREPMTDLTPLLTSEGVGPDGELRPTLDADGNLVKPDDDNTPKLDGGDDPLDDYDDDHPDPRQRKR